jgi:hypothetical protein
VSSNLLTITISGIALRSEVDGEDTIAPEDVGAETDQARNRLVVVAGRDLVTLEEADARRRQFNRFREISADQLFHAGKAHRSVLQHVERRVVGVVSQHVAKSKRYYCLGFKPCIGS